MGEQGEIYKLLPRVMADVGAIPLGHRNKAQSYQFRSVYDVLNAVHPTLVRHGVSLGTSVENYQTAVEREAKAGNQGERLVYRATLLLNVRLSAPDGSSVTFTAAGEGIDYGGDKATNKAMSAAFKYAMFLGLAIPIAPGDADDSDEGGAPPVKPASTAPKTPAAPSASAYSQPLAAACTEAQKQQIIYRWRQLRYTPEKLAAVLETLGVKKVSQITVGQADKLINQLVAKETEKQAAEVFQSGR